MFCFFQVLTTSYTYDSKGRLETKTYPSGFAIKQVYNNYGYHFQTIRADGSNSVIWQLTAKNAFDQTTNYYFGNGVTTSKTFDSYNLLRNINSTNPNATEISRQEIYKYQTEFDPSNGNLKFRTDAKTGRNFREDFQYDDLDRLWKITRTGEPDKVINYYDNGNISSKFDVGNYAYNATKPNAVENVGNTSPFSSRTQIIEYSTIGKATSIKEGIYKSELIYGLSNERIIMYERLKRDTTSAVYDSLKSTNYYAGDYEIVKNQAGLETKRHYIFGPDGLIGVYIITTTGSGQLYYTTTDHLGSISVLTDQGGLVVEEYSFDSWGRRRDPNNWSNYTSPVNGWTSLLTRGYTFHEHLEKHGLINMNGRLYDPLTGRMLSPDNYVQEPQNTQSHNRYTYAFNNPLKFTDPSGNITWWDVLAVGEIIGGVILGFTPASSLSPSFIASGVNHFAATASVMQDAKAQGYNISYDDASNGVGIGFSYSFTFGGGGSQQKQPPGTTNTPPPPIETSTAPVANVSPIPSGPFLASRSGISDSWSIGNKNNFPLMDDIYFNYPRPFSVKPYANGPSNQCAIRVSMAVQNSGYDFSNYFTGYKGKAYGGKYDGYPAGAAGLANYFNRSDVLGKPKRYSQSDGNYYNFDTSQQGIIYFADYNRSGVEEIKHIDIYYNGSIMMGDGSIMNPSQTGYDTYYFWSLK